MRYFDIVPPANQRQPIEPHTIISGILPGATQIRIGGDANVLIDGLNRRITITQSDGSSVGVGIIPGDTSHSGFFVVDGSGNIVMKIIGPTRYIYDITTGKNIIQDGKLPDGTYGLAIAKSGYNISDAIS